MSAMKFCRQCNNTLYPKEDRVRRALLYACRNCDHQEVADSNCVYKMEIHHSASERSQYLQDATADPTLPHTKSVRCCNCNHSEAVFFETCRTCRRLLRAMKVWHCSLSAAIQIAVTGGGIDEDGTIFAAPVHTGPLQN